MHYGKNPDVVLRVCFILYNESLASCFSTLVLWERLYPELLKGSTGSLHYVHKCATQNCVDACCHTCFHTHINTHCPLCWIVSPEAGCVLQILFVYFGFLPCCCQSLVFIQSLRCLLRVYPVSSGFYTVLRLFLNWLLLLFSSVCVCAQDLNKRLSLPADIRIPDGYLEKLQLSSPPFDQPLSRRSRRASLVRLKGKRRREEETVMIRQWRTIRNVLLLSWYCVSNLPAEDNDSQLAPVL